MNTGPVATGSVPTEAGRNGNGIEIPASEKRRPAALIRERAA
jgi:hypothetical protein